jgi:hypothetical protein
VTWIGAVTSASGDNIVFANSVENTTIAGTDWNLCPSGILDALTSTSLHGLSGGTVANWNPALYSTTAGRFSGLKLRKARQAIGNLGGGKADLVIWSNGVENDTIEAERALSALLRNVRHGAGRLGEGQGDRVLHLEEGAARLRLHPRPGRDSGQVLAAA